MIELRLLGPTDLRGVAAEEAGALLAQSKCVALLAYLALASPGALHRRDRLVGLLWPELDQEHARAALRKAVYALRRALGAAALAARGDEEIGLAPDAVWCDAVEFSECVEKSYYSRALELYRRGELLPGFFVQDAGEFEDWLERSRTELRDRAAACAWGLAARFEDGGDYTIATRYARHAAALAPTDERMLRRVMQLLDRLGDRAGAVHVYDDFARRLKREYDAEPSPETQALSARVRGATAR
ncbi:transcriptional activator domain-containing protein (plasmid) [Gemmatirosa kalamazoonensis]|uniref:Transcriptional activator domain-containing protein n=1 Tax=Gemmatirosa kalamazoonensis TaxID=861299 RepID=W0RRF4_9BACT|nr:BTAD domain-containing putative transcriptional regulator [Gemmatirosa kalamazoonensis]AHG93569.1 transcriptional activator domain-containing protein [Gemmatirosa kalamazoonensis]